MKKGGLYKMKKKLLFMIMVLTLVGCINISDSVSPKTIKSSDVKFSNGKLILKSTLLPFTGIVTNNYGTGKVLSKGIYKNGQIDGEVIFYYETGKILSKLNYKDGKLSGKATGYYENNNIQWKGNFINAKLNGEFNNYYETGKKLSKLHYKNGRLDGKIFFYYKSGKLKSKELYKDGVKIEKRVEKSTLENSSR